MTDAMTRLPMVTDRDAAEFGEYATGRHVGLHAETLVKRLLADRERTLGLIKRVEVYREAVPAPLWEEACDILKEVGRDA